MSKFTNTLPPVLISLGLFSAACASSEKGQSAPLSSNASSSQTSKVSKEKKILSVLDVDWKNREYTEFANDELYSKSYSVVDGRASKNEGGLLIKALHFGDVNGDGKDEAIVHTELTTGGSGHFDQVWIFSVVAGEIQELGIIPGGDRHDGGLESVQFRNGKIVVRRLHSQLGDQSCTQCDSLQESWQWQNEKISKVFSSPDLSMKAEERAIAEADAKYCDYMALRGMWKLSVSDTGEQKSAPYCNIFDESWEEGKELDFRYRWKHVGLNFKIDGSMDLDFRFQEDEFSKKKACRFSVSGSQGHSVYSAEFEVQAPFGERIEGLSSIRFDRDDDSEDCEDCTALCENKLKFSLERVK